MHENRVERRRRSAARSAAAPSLALSIAMLLGGCAGIDPLGPQPLGAAAQSAVHGRGNVTVRLEPDGTAVVRGWVEDTISERSVLNEVAAYPGVTGVVDYLRVDNLLR